METAVGIVLIIMAVFLVIAVLMQSGKSAGLGVISGGAETFFGKSKGEKLDKVLPKITTVVAIVFAVIVLLAYLVQDDATYDNVYKDYIDSLNSSETTETVGTEADTTSDTTAE